ncbi:cytochrome c biogenesis protein CcdA [uncultured Porphyromonas sp.]|uniref:protein-disulfide reductase DsbD family protein n=1 Tax=uncultured Porphyromonas sp. TaxID=159274 RepID=UPI002592BCD6|nr:cytochrome c biogenesis protein CcdA [uncultured Porphyromonas sp.]
MRKHLVTLFALLLATICSTQAGAQMFENIVRWETAQTNDADGVVTLTYTATIQSGWHIYGVDLPEDGPTVTTADLSESKGIKALTGLTPDRKPATTYDPNFAMDLTTFDGKVTFTQKVQILDPTNFVIKGDLIWQACNDETCTPPDRYSFSYGPKDLKTAVTSVPATDVEEGGAVVADEPAPEPVALTEGTADTDDAALYESVESELRAYGDKNFTSPDTSLWKIFILGFLGGLVALFTPCVWPIIPMTVSFFMHRSQSKESALRDAIIYGLSIVVIYVALGLLVTGIFGASALNELSTNAIFNIFLFLLLVVFSISFFGAFEITLPSSWTNKVSTSASTSSGLLSIFFMAFTLVLVSFSCTGPIIGTLLVQAAAEGNILGPTLGMLGFALALALPFTLFAIFPNWLQSMPKSGGWLNSVKVVLAFIELALSLKFLSVADLAYGWHILDRETFVALWIAISFLLGLYLLGIIRFPADDKKESVSWFGTLLATIVFAFGIYMVPGLWGAPLKAISAFAPPLTTQDFNLYDSEVHAKFDDYEAGMAYAKREGKPVIIDFSGYGCVNCRKMEASVWTDPTVKDILDNDFVLITLIVDDKARLAQPLEVTETNGDRRTLKTVGERWSYFQRTKFGSNAQPFYVMLDNTGHPLAASYGFDEDVDKYITWLRGGLKAYKDRQ